MNKSQLVETLAARFEGNKKAAQHALESVLDTITRAVASGERVAITGFGAFEKIERPSRMVRNPRTGERKRAKKTAVPKFRAGQELKNVVSGAKKLPKLSTAKATTTRTSTGTAAKKATATKATGATKRTTKAASAAPAKSTRSTGRSAAKTPARASAAKSPAKAAASTRTARSTAKTTAKRAPAKRTTTKRTTRGR